MNNSESYHPFWPLVLFRNSMSSIVYDKSNKQSQQVTQKFDLNMDEHRILLKDLEQRLKTNGITGLTFVEAERRLSQFGVNSSGHMKNISWRGRLLYEFHQVPIYFQLAGICLCLILYGIFNLESYIFIAIILIQIFLLYGLVNTILQTNQESPNKGIPEQIQVIRDSQIFTIPVCDIVPGDVVRIKAGNKIPADMRIIESSNLKVDNSRLTGEEYLITKSTECGTMCNPIESSNIVFQETFCKEGYGVGIVLFTGVGTLAGQHPQQVSLGFQSCSYLQNQLKVTVLAWAGFCLIFIILYITVRYGLNQQSIDTHTVIQFIICLFLAFIPISLRTNILLALKLATLRLNKQNIYIKQPQKLLDIGSVTCFCLGKSGVITKHQEEVTDIWCNNEQLKINDKIQLNQKQIYDQGLIKLLETAVVCSNAVFDVSAPLDIITKIINQIEMNVEIKSQKLQQVQSKWDQMISKLAFSDYPAKGTASDVAIIQFVQQFMPIELIRQHNTTQLVNIEKQLIFKQRRFKCSYSILQLDKGESSYRILIKGAPEAIWSLCGSIWLNGKVSLKDEQQELIFNQNLNQLEKQGKKLVGFSILDLSSTEYPSGYNFKNNQFDIPLTQYQFLGIMAFQHVVQVGVAQVIRQLKLSDINITMFTADYPITAQYIAKQCQIITHQTVNELAEQQLMSFQMAFNRSNSIVISGQQINALTNDINQQGLELQLNKWLSKQEVVFGRITPVQKALIVKCYQKNQHVVAVVGDMAKDSEAIKQSDVGFSMGSGSDVTKAAADIILLDNKFTNIIVALEEGRRVIDNIEKTRLFLFSVHPAQFMPIILTILLQIPMPLSPIQILLASQLTSILAISFAYQTSEIGIMNKGRIVKQSIIRRMFFAYTQYGFFQTLSGLLCYFIILNDYGLPFKQSLFITSKFGIQPRLDDVFDQANPYLGNSNLLKLYNNRMLIQPNTADQFCTQDDEIQLVHVDWENESLMDFDLRMFLIHCNLTTSRWEQLVEWGECKVNHVSPVTKLPICYTTKMQNYAQTGYLYGILVFQISSYYSIASRQFGFYQNISIQFLGAITMVIIVLLVTTHISILSIVFGTGDVTLIHMGLPAIPIAIYGHLWSQFRKALSHKYSRYQFE